MVIERGLPAIQGHAGDQVELHLHIERQDQDIQLGIPGVAQIGLGAQHLEVARTPDARLFPFGLQFAPRQGGGTLGDLVLVPAHTEVMHHIDDVLLQDLSGILDQGLLVLHTNPGAHLGSPVAEIADRSFHLYLDVAVPAA